MEQTKKVEAIINKMDFSDFLLGHWENTRKPDVYHILKRGITGFQVGHQDCLLDEKTIQSLIVFGTLTQGNSTNVLFISVHLYQR